MMFFFKKISAIGLAFIGVLAILLAGFVCFLSVKEMLALPNEPQHMPISEALSKASEKRLWVILDDIQWDCDHVYYFERNPSGDTYIVFMDKDKTVLGLALFSGRKNCQVVKQNEVAGVLEVGIKGTDGATLSRLLSQNGFDVALHEKNGTLVSFCTFCGQKNSLLGIALSAIFLIIGLFLFIPFIKAKKAQKAIITL